MKRERERGVPLKGCLFSKVCSPVTPEVESKGLAALLKELGQTKAQDACNRSA